MHAREFSKVLHLQRQHGWARFVSMQDHYNLLAREEDLDDAVASLEVELTDDEVAELEAPYTPRADFQGVSDGAELGRISARLGIKPAGS